MALQNKKKEATINLLTSLNGLAWRQIEHAADKLADEEEGFTKVLQMLDACFKYNEKVEMPRAFEKFFYSLYRQPTQTLLSYTTEHREHLREIEKFGVKIPSAISGWLMLRRAGLTAEQRQLVQTNVGASMEETKIEEAMFLLFGQDYRRTVNEPSRGFRGKGASTGAPRWSSRRGHAAYSAIDETTAENDYEYDFEETYAVDEDDSLDYDFTEDPGAPWDGDELYWQDEQSWDDAAYYEQHDDALPDEEYEEVYATYLDARRRFADLKAARGFWPVMAVPPSASGTSTSQAPSYAPSKGKPTKGKGKGGKSKGKGGQRPFFQKGSASQRASSAAVCLRCGQSGHYSDSCPNPSSKSSTPNGSQSPVKKAKTTESYAYMVHSYVDAGNHRSLRGTLDNGASSVLMGHNTLMKNLKILHAAGRDLRHLSFRPVDKTFHFGGDASSRAEWSIHLPVSIGGSFGRLQVFLIPGDTPFLLGRPVLKHFKIQIDYALDKISIDGSAWTSTLKGPREEYLIDLHSSSDDWCQDWDFDLMTDDTLDNFTYHPDNDTINLEEYLNITQLPPPEFTFTTVDTFPDNDLTNTSPDLSPQPHLDHDEDPTAVFKPVTNKLLKAMAMHHHTEKVSRKRVVDRIMHFYEKGVKQFWEVYAGQSNLSKAMAALGYEVTSFDLNAGWNFEKAHHRREFFKLFRKVCPDFVWLAPPCTVWSPLQSLTPRSDEQLHALQCERDYQEHVHLKFTGRVFEEQLDEGRDSAVEQPDRALSWKTPTFQKLLAKGHRSRLDQCAYGAKLPDEHGNLTYIRKPTSLCLTSSTLAQDLSRTCPGGHRHLPIEGSSPGVGNRAKASATYQPSMCKQLATSIDNYLNTKNIENSFTTSDTPDPVQHPPSSSPQSNLPPPQHAVPPDPSLELEQSQPTQRGILHRLSPTTNLEANRTIQRLHRNLGHPTTAQLEKLLIERKANDRLLKANRFFQCEHCAHKAPPSQVPKSSIYKGTFFNDRVQADTLWLKVQPAADSGTKVRAFPILVISDATTRLCAARLLPDETPESFQKGLERAWIRSFGPMRLLQVDEHRSWASDHIKTWSGHHSIQLMISPGQAHERLAIIERRHQVIRRSLDLFLLESKDYTPDGIINALNYVIPQVNRMPNVQGYSPLQWTLGYNPHVPGLLMEEELNPTQLHPTEAFRLKLNYQQVATKAITQANNDDRLRRALLRRYSGVKHSLQTGDLCYYWRDVVNNSRPGPKISWKGPATIVMIEREPHEVLWLVHGTTMLRASPEHVKPVLSPDTSTTTVNMEQPLQRAQQSLQQIRNRGVTQYVDLSKTNKRTRDEVETEDEMDQTDQPSPPEPSSVGCDSWSVSSDGQTWKRIHRRPRSNLNIPVAADQAPVHLFTPTRTSEISRPEPAPTIVIQDDWTIDQDKTMGFEWTGSTTFHLRAQDEPSDDDLDPEVRDILDAPLTTTSPQPLSTTTPTTTPSPHDDEPASAPDLPADHVPNEQQLDQLGPAFRPQPDEDFRAKRARLDQQETISYKPHQPPPTTTTFGPQRRHEQALPPHSTSSPYGNRPSDDAALSQEVEIDMTSENTDLPPGWHFEDGYIVMNDIHDEWQIKGNYLLRRHYVPRTNTYEPCEDTCPIPLEHLGKTRNTLFGDTNYHDRWHMKNKEFPNQWTGTTRFKILPNYRKLAHDVFYNVSDGYTSYTEPKSKDKNNLDERKMSLADRLAFTEAKRKELTSFFEHDVWEFCSPQQADSSRILKAHFILKWSTNADGSPRAKARLITQGFRDPDALSGALRTNSPTLTRMSRGMILSIASLMSWTTFTSDISTAFLQGKPHHKDRTLWIKLPRDACQILGLPTTDSKVMQLKKPMYGLCDAPRAWYMEAVERILSLDNVYRHPLDACLFLVFDPADKSQLHPVNKAICDAPGKLVATFGIHVDDLLGCGDINNDVYKRTKEKLHQLFSFRMWEESGTLQYCGCDIINNDEGITLKQTDYINKQKPISMTSTRKADVNSPLTQKETTQLRALIGALQWPCTQSSPYLQCSISQLAGKVSKATIGTIDHGNKILRMAKANSDVSLQYTNLGDINDITFVTYADAAYANRDDLTSQGGYLLCMVNKTVTSGDEGRYNLVDWRSWKLARVARSSLSAESQATAEAADALLFACLFWRLIFNPSLPIDHDTSAQLLHPPAHVVDAKALYDLLVKDEIQAALGSDKRTAVETLVAQDKLKVCKAQIKWVSSEKQYADGMTKSDAAQLLADRLRSHKMRLTSDTSFQAVKKKTSYQRKKGEELYAIKKPSKALRAMTAATAITTTQSFNLTENHDPENSITDDHFTYTNFFLTFVFIMALAHCIHLLPHFYNTFTNLCNFILRWLRRPDEPEPEGEDLTEPLLLDGPANQDGQQPDLHGDGMDDEAAVPQTANPVGDPGEPEPPLEDVVTNLENLVEFLRGQLRLANEDNLRNHRQLQDLLQEHEQLTEQHEAARRVAGNFYMDRQLVLHNADQERARQEQQIQMAINQRINQLLNRDVFFTPRGECWHLSEACARARAHSTVFGRRACRVCVHALQVQQEGPHG